MASSFWNGTFYFNNIHCSNYNVCIVDYNENDMLKQIGTNFSLSLDKEESMGHAPTYNETEVTSENVTLQLAKTDGTKWSVSDLMNVNKWLFTKNFSKFQTTDYDNGVLNVVYYLKAVSMKKFLNPDSYGYIEVEFASYEPYAYIIPTSNYTLSGNDSMTLYSYSNLYDNYKPKIRIRNSSGVTITNSTSGKPGLTLSGLGGEEVIVDCKMGTVLNSSGVNRFETLQNYNFLELVSGNNSIQTSGSGTVEIICEFPIII